MFQKMYLTKDCSANLCKSAKFRLQREAAIARSLSAHSNINTTYGGIFNKNINCIVMHRACINLRQVAIQAGSLIFCSNIHAQRMYYCNLTYCMLHIASALEYMHSRNMIHCDVKPDNILVYKDFYGPPIAALADFGSTLIVADPQELTQTKAMSGTLYYLPPESLSVPLAILEKFRRLGSETEAFSFDKMPSSIVSSGTDVWGFGCTLLQLLNFGVHPFSELFSNADEYYMHMLPYKTFTTSKAKNGAYTNALDTFSVQVTGNCPPALIDIAQECLVMNPTHRVLMKQISDKLRDVGKLLSGEISAEYERKGYGLSDLATAAYFSGDFYRFDVNISKNLTNLQKPQVSKLSPRRFRMHMKSRRTSEKSKDQSQELQNLKDRHKMVAYLAVNFMEQNQTQKFTPKHDQSLLDDAIAFEIRDFLLRTFHPLPKALNDRFDGAVIGRTMAGQTFPGPQRGAYYFSPEGMRKFMTRSQIDLLSLPAPEPSSPAPLLTPIVRDSTKEEVIDGLETAMRNARSTIEHLESVLPRLSADNFKVAQDTLATIREYISTVTLVRTDLLNRGKPVDVKRLLYQPIEYFCDKPDPENSSSSYLLTLVQAHRPRE